MSEVVVDTSASEAEDPKHVEAMLAAAEQAEQINDPTRPEWLPENFKSPEDLANSYKELQREYTKTREELKKASGDAENTSENTAENAEKPETTPDQEAASEELEKRGLDMNALSQEYMENGELSADSYKALEAAGIDKNTVDNYIAGMQAKTQLELAETYALAGGEDAYNKITEWAAKNLSEDDIKAYDAAVTSGDAHQRKLAVDGLKARFEKEYGSLEDLPQAGNSVSTAERYESVQELQADMNNPRYGVDDAFTQRVVQKLSRSNIL